jgi:hypothetical protein
MREYNSGNGLTHLITMIFTSGKGCQLPLDGTNTNMFTRAMVPQG